MDYPDLKTVGVFVNAGIESVKKFRRRCGLDLVQLHGDEAPDYVEQLGSGVIKAFRVSDNNSILTEIDKYSTDYILLDTFHPDKYGGTGASFDWEILNHLTDRKIFLAGGINPANYSRAISYQPYAVDINSGVERAPGKKEEDLVKEILNRK